MKFLFALTLLPIFTFTGSAMAGSPADILKIVCFQRQSITIKAGDSQDYYSYLSSTAPTPQKEADGYTYYYSPASMTCSRSDSNGCYGMVQVQGNFHNSADSIIGGNGNYSLYPNTGTCN